MKILFYRGKEINIKTKVDEAEIFFNKDILVKTQNYIYYIDNITKVTSEIIKPLGTVIKLIVIMILYIWQYQEYI